MDRDFLEVYYEVSASIEEAIHKGNAVVMKEYNRDGYPSRYDMAIDWTNEFQEIHKDTDWGQVEYLETIEHFIHQKLNSKCH